MPIVRYSREEVVKIRRAIASSTPAGLREDMERMDPELRKHVREVQQGTPGVFWLHGLFREEKTLLEKILEDPRATKFSIFMFFPILDPHRDSPMRDADIWIIPHERGRKLYVTLWLPQTGKVESGHRTKKVVVIKTVCSPDEARASYYAGEKGIGPPQHTSLSGFLTEDTVPGRDFSEAACGMDETVARGIGERTAALLFQLHRARIAYNDTLFLDDRLRVDGNAVRCKEFMGAVDLSAFPEIRTDQLLYLMENAKRAQMAMGGLSMGEQEQILREALTQFVRGGMEKMFEEDMQRREIEIRVAAAQSDNPRVLQVWEGFYREYARLKKAR